MLTLFWESFSMNNKSVLRKIIKESLENIIDSVDYKSIEESLESLRKTIADNGAFKHLGRDIKENKTRSYATLQLDVVSKLTGIPINELTLYFINKVKTYNESVLVEMQQQIVYFYENFQNVQNLQESKTEFTEKNNKEVPQIKQKVPPKSLKVSEKDLKTKYPTLADMLVIDLSRDKETEVPEIKNDEDFEDHTESTELTEDVNCNEIQNKECDNADDLQKDAGIRLQQSLINDPVQESACGCRHDKDLQTRMNKILDKIVINKIPSNIGGPK